MLNSSIHWLKMSNRSPQHALGQSVQEEKRREDTEGSSVKQARPFLRHSALFGNNIPQRHVHAITCKSQLAGQWTRVQQASHFWSATEAKPLTLSFAAACMTAQLQTPHQAGSQVARHAKKPVIGLCCMISEIVFNGSLLIVLWARWNGLTS